MAEITFNEEETKLPYDEYFKILAWLDKSLSVGVELERPCNAPKPVIASRLNTKVSDENARGDGSLPQYKRAACGKYNCFDVRCDGTVHTNAGTSGVEIVFAGTTERFAYIQQRLEEIEKILDTLGCDDYDSSCSNHISVVSVQDRLLPANVMKNILQITRGFSSGLYWLCSAEKRRISRQSISHNAPFAVTFTPFGKSLRDMIAMGKYNLCNMSKQPTFRAGAGEDDIWMAGLFVEFRNPDGMRVPSALAALMMMYKAVVYKAVELSTKGVLNIDSLGQFSEFAEWQKNKRTSMAIIEGSPIVEEKEYAKKNAKALLDFIMPQLKMVSPDAVDILQALADKPVGLRYRKIDATYRTIEKELSGRKNDDALSDKEQRIVEIVTGGQLRAATPALYREEMAKQLNVTVRMVEYLMQKIREKTGKGMVYDSEINRYRIE
jgi:DNA-binding CsgD family transcriptional regulator